MKLQRIRSIIRELYENHIKRIEKGYLIRHHFFYKYYLKIVKDFRFSPKPLKNISWTNTVLKTREEVQYAIKTIKNSNLNLNIRDVEKNWDSLIALKIIFQNSNPKAMILDAGGLPESLILSWLYQFGYKNLKCLNLLFKKREKRGNIELIPGDLTRTSFPDDYFDIITCLSVIEHGVNDVQYFKEMNRILKKGGLLITSTDYWESKINTNEKYAYNNPVLIYDKNSINKLLNIAFKSNFTLFGSEVDLNCLEKVVHWKRFDLHYTFLIFCLQNCSKYTSTKFI